MSPQTIVRSWLAGWRHLVFHHEVYGPGYLSVASRLRIELCALCRLPADARFRCAVLLLIAAQLLALSLAWHLDLTGWRRDVLRTMPGLLSLPWLATARNIAIRAWLERRHFANRD